MDKPSPSSSPRSAREQPHASEAPRSDASQAHMSARTDTRLPPKKGPRLASDSIDQIAKLFRTGSAGDFSRKSEHASLLLPLLEALGWRGASRTLFEALPHFADDLELIDIRNILSSLGYISREKKLRKASDLDNRLLPCLVETEDRHLILIKSHDENGFSVVRGSSLKEEICPDLPGLRRACLVSRRDMNMSGTATASDREKSHSPYGWTRDLLKRFDKTAIQLFAVSFMVNLLALVTPIFILVLYDRVIPSRSFPMWTGLTVGLLLLFVLDLYLKVLRARFVAYLAGRIDYQIALSTFGRILNLPAHMTESANLGDQVAKLKDFDSIRDLFTGLFVTVILDLPFLILALLALFLLGGSLIFVPIVLMSIYGLVWLFIRPKLRRLVKKASQAKAARHGFLVETISNLRTIKEAAMENIWAERFRDFSATAALTHHGTSQITFLLQSLSQAFMVLGGLMTLILGVTMAIDGTLSLGALIAAMALIWRILSPLQNLFLGLARSEQIKGAIAQIDTLMKIKPETDRRKERSGLARTWQGSVAFQRVSLRYAPHSEPALLGVSFNVNAGEFLAVTGGNGSGKTSVLRTLLALHRPQAGQITLDGIDTRQIPAPELRTNLAYVPQVTKVFHGSIAQNLRLAHPSASDNAIREACRLSGLLTEIETFEKGFDTRLGDQSVWQINAGFLQKLSLARAYISPAPVLLLDEPAQALDEEGDVCLIRALEHFHHKKTIIMVSHRPSHIKLADRVLVLKNGTVIAAGTPDEIYDQRLRSDRG